MPEKLFVFGASGHAKVVIDSARLQGHEVVAVFDDNPALLGRSLLGVSVLGGRDLVPTWSRAHGVTAGIVAIGLNSIRLEVALWLMSAGMRMVSVVHPRATVAGDVRLGDGCVLMAGAVINSGTRLGEHCIVNTGACVDHDCELDDGVHIAPGCHLCGNVSVGTQTLIGAGSTVIQGLRVGARVLVAAGSTVIRDVADEMKVAGLPSREMK